VAKTRTNDTQPVVARRLQIVGVSCSHADERPDEQLRAEELGAYLATLDVHLLTGGGPGSMRAVAGAFVGCNSRGRGLSVGIIPSKKLGTVTPKDGYPNEFIEVAIYTHLSSKGTGLERQLHSRNSIVAGTPQLIVALAGSTGTLEEITLARGFGVPVVAYLGSRSDLRGLPSDVSVISDFDKLRGVIASQLAASGRE
jgi:uncharacterized protein (TIGR00725 family)